MGFQRAFLLATLALGCDHSSSCPPWMCAGQAAQTAPVAAGSDVGRVAPSGGALDAKVILPLIAPKPGSKHSAHTHRDGGGGGGGGGGGRSTASAETPDPPARPRDHGLANGVACTFSSDCASGDCSFGKCEASGGEKALGNGVACTFSSDCASGDCTFGVCKGRDD